jgi:hypothetical protein
VVQKAKALFPMGAIGSASQLPGKSGTGQPLGAPASSPARASLYWDFTKQQGEKDAGQLSPIPCRRDAGAPRGPGFRFSGGIFDSHFRLHLFPIAEHDNSILQYTIYDLFVLRR